MSSSPPSQEAQEHKTQPAALGRSTAPRKTLKVEAGRGMHKLLVSLLCTVVQYTTGIKIYHSEIHASTASHLPRNQSSSILRKRCIQRVSVCETNQHQPTKHSLTWCTCNCLLHISLHAIIIPQCNNLSRAKQQVGFCTGQA